MIPLTEAISHLGETIDKPARHEQIVDKQSNHSGSLLNHIISSASFNAGLPPLLVTLDERVQKGEFIDMSKFTVDRLSMAPQDESSSPVMSEGGHLPPLFSGYNVLCNILS